MADISTYKAFLNAQKQLVDLIPKSKQGAIYKGFSSIFEEAVKTYILEERKEFEKELESKNDQLIISLKDRIEFLEGLCENNGIDINPHNPKGSVID